MRVKCVVSVECADELNKAGAPRSTQDRPQRGLALRPTLSQMETSPLHPHKTGKLAGRSQTMNTVLTDIWPDFTLPPNFHRSSSIFQLYVNETRSYGDCRVRRNFAASAGKSSGRLNFCRKCRTVHLPAFLQYSRQQRVRSSLKSEWGH